MRKVLLGILSVMMVPAIASAWVAYNDMAWFSGTLTDISTNTVYAGDGILYDQSNSGATVTGVTVTITSDATDGYGGTVVNNGTSTLNGDAATYFGGIVDTMGVVQGGGGTYHLLSFTGLEDAYTYNFVIYGNRGGATNYNTRHTDFIIEGAPSFVNNSSTGVAVDQTGVPNDTSKITNGVNTVNGWVARFEDITTGGDGAFEIRITDERPASTRHYVSAFMIEEVIPEPSTLALFGLGSLLLMLRRKKK